MIFSYDLIKKGQCLNFDCAFVVVLMLRNSLTWLRMHGMANIFPLDNHVYLHKMVGITTVFFGALHTVMHLINFRTLNFTNFSNISYFVTIICVISFKK